MEELTVSMAMSSSSLLMKRGCDVVVMLKLYQRRQRRRRHETRLNENACERPMRWFEIKLIERVKFSISIVFRNEAGEKIMKL